MTEEETGPCQPSLNSTKEVAVLTYIVTHVIIPHTSPLISIIKRSGYFLRLTLLVDVIADKNIFELRY